MLKIGFYNGNVLKIIEDLTILKPTHFPTVPRLFNKIYSKIKSKFEEKNFVLRELINRGIETKLHNLRKDACQTQQASKHRTSNHEYMQNLGAYADLGTVHAHTCTFCLYIYVSVSPNIFFIYIYIYTRREANKQKKHICIHTFLHTFMHMHTHTFTHTDIQTDSQPDMHTNIHMWSSD